MCCPRNAPPRSVQAALRPTAEFVNGMPNVNRNLAFGDGTREKPRARLAGRLRASASEVVLTRGTTEALNIITAGVRLERGDEVITTNLDYPSLRAAWLLRGLRDGIHLVEVEIPALRPDPPRRPRERAPRPVARCGRDPTRRPPGPESWPPAT